MPDFLDLRPLTFRLPLELLSFLTLESCEDLVQTKFIKSQTRTAILKKKRKKRKKEKNLSENEICGILVILFLIDRKSIFENSYYYHHQ